MDIEGNLKAYLSAREPTARYTSFDYCFNYFREHYERGASAELLRDDNLQVSCLQLGFYLASWGMLRGSSDLLQRSVKVLAPVIDVIAGAQREIWEFDADQYGDGRCEALLEIKKQIVAALPAGASDILVTKIMLGTFGCVPAFDTYFKRGFGISTFGPKALHKIGAFYISNADTIERHRVHTLDFSTGRETERPYTRAKVIDMIFFVAGGAPS